MNRRLSRQGLTFGLTLLAALHSGCALLSGSVAQRGLTPHQNFQQSETREIRSPEPTTLADRVREGDALRKDGRSAAAMWSYLQAHELDPEDPGPIARMAGLHLAVEPERAEAIFQDLARTHPESSAAHTGLGLTLIARQDWAAAREALERAVEFDPRSAPAFSALGVSLDRQGLHAEARDAYLRATALQPRYYEALNNLGVSYLATEDFANAAEALQRAAAQQDRDPAVLNNLGLALGRMGRYDDALEAFERAGSEQAARNNLGYVSYLNGDYERAIAEYELALLAPGDQRLLVLRNFRAARSAEKPGRPPTEDRQH